MVNLPLIRFPSQSIVMALPLAASLASGLPAFAQGLQGIDFDALKAPATTMMEHLPDLGRILHPPGYDRYLDMAREIGRDSAVAEDRRNRDAAVAMGQAATGAENAIVDGGSRQLPEGFRVTYLVSSAQGEDALKALFALYAGRTDIRFAFRGIPPGMTVPDFGVWLLSLFENQSLLETTEIVIDPEIFTHTAATLAPTLVLEDVTRPQTDLAPGQPAISDPSETSASVLATAIGTGTPQWLYDRYRSGQTSYSSVNAVPITEEDLRIRAEREATAQLAKLTTDPEVLANRYWDRLARDLDRAPVTPALIARDRPLRAFYEVTSPIRDAEGRILAYPGEVFDPSTVLPFDRQILVFDPTRPAELGFVAERLAAPPPGVVRQMLIASRLPAVTAGQAPWQGLQDLVDRFRLPVYVLTADFRRGFGVEHTPTEIRPVGSSVILTETAVGGGTDAP